MPIDTERPRISGNIGWRKANTEAWANREGSQPKVKQSLAESLLRTPYRRTISLSEEEPVSVPNKSFTLNLKDALVNHKEMAVLAIILSLGVGSLGARIINDLPYINALHAASTPQTPSLAPEPEPKPQPPVPDKKPAVKYPSDYLREAYLGLTLPTAEGKNVAGIMAELGYRVHSFVHLPEIPEKLRADDTGNYVRRVPIDEEGKEFFDKFWIGNIKDRINAKEEIINIATLAVINPDQSVDFIAVDPRGWVRVATKKVDGVKLHVQEEDMGEELKKAIYGFQMPTQIFSKITV